MLKVTAYLGATTSTRRPSSSPNAPSSWPERVGDAHLESAALDQLTAVFRSRTANWTAPPPPPNAAWSCSPPWPTTSRWRGRSRTPSTWRRWSYLAAGDLETARRYAKQRSELPSFREADHLAVEWLLTTAALVGDFDEAVELGGALPSGVDGGRPAPARRYRLRAGCGGHGVRHPRRRRGAARVARHRQRDAPRGDPTRWQNRLQPSLRRAGGVAPRSVRCRAHPRGERTGVVQALERRRLAALVRGRLGRGRGARSPARPTSTASTGRSSSSVTTRSRRRSSTAPTPSTPATQTGSWLVPPPSTPPGAGISGPAPLSSPGARRGPKASRSWRQSERHLWPPDRRAEETNRERRETPQQGGGFRGLFRSLVVGVAPRVGAAIVLEFHDADLEPPRLAAVAAVR